MMEDSKKAVSRDGYHHQIGHVKNERSTQDIPVRDFKVTRDSGTTCALKRTSSNLHKDVKTLHIVVQSVCSILINAFKTTF